MRHPARQSTGRRCTKGRDVVFLHFAAIPEHQSCGQTYKRGFPDSIGPDQCGDEAPADFDGYIIECPRDFAVVAEERLMNIAAYQCRRDRSGGTHCTG